MALGFHLLICFFPGKHVFFFEPPYNHVNLLGGLSWYVFMMQHVTAEGTALVKQAEDAASNKKVCALIIFSFN